jgi:hypothetical protein
MIHMLSALTLADIHVHTRIGGVTEFKINPAVPARTAGFFISPQP